METNCEKVSFSSSDFWFNSINSNMDRQIKKASITPDDKQNALNRINLVTDLNALKSVLHFLDQYALFQLNI